MKLPNFFFDIRLSMRWQNDFVTILLKTGLVGKDLYDRGKIIQVWLTLGITIMLLETKNISSQSLMVMLLIVIVLTEEPFPCWKPKKEWEFKCKSWIKKLINCCFFQNIAKYKLTAYLMYQCYFFFYLYKYLIRYWAN